MILTIDDYDWSFAYYYETAITQQEEEAKDNPTQETEENESQEQ